MSSSASCRDRRAQYARTLAEVARMVEAEAQAGGQLTIILKVHRDGSLHATYLVPYDRNHACEST